MPMGPMPATPGGLGPAFDPSNMPAFDVDQLVNELEELKKNPEMMRQMEEFIRNAPPELLEQAAKIGENMIGSLTPEEQKRVESKVEEIAQAAPPSLYQPTAPVPQPTAAPSFQKPPSLPRPKKMIPSPITTENDDGGAASIPEKPAPETIKLVKELLDTIIYHLDSLILKTVDDTIFIATRPALLEIQTLRFLLTAINKSEFHTRLAQNSYAKIRDTLSELSRALTKREPRVTAPVVEAPEEELKTPYETLGVSPRASDEEIKIAYEALLKKHDPEKVAKKLEAEDASEEDITREMLKADIARTEIVEAWNEIGRDPKMREQADRIIQAKDQERIEQYRITYDRTENLVTELGKYIFALLTTVENIIRQYEPEALKQKEAMEEMENARLQEREKLLSTRPIKLSTGRLDPYYHVPETVPNSNFFNGYGGYPSWLPSAEQPSLESPHTDNHLKSTAPGQKPTEPDKKSKAEKPVHVESKTKRAERAQKVDTRSVHQMLQDLTKNIKSAKKSLENPETQKLITRIRSAEPTTLTEKEKVEEATPDKEEAKTEKKPDADTEEAKKLRAEGFKELPHELTEEELEEKPGLSVEPKKAAVKPREKISEKEISTLTEGLALKKASDTAQNLIKIINILREPPTDKELEAYDKLTDEFEKRDNLEALAGALGSSKLTDPKIREAQTNISTLMRNVDSLKSFFTYHPGKGGEKKEKLSGSELKTEAKTTPTETPAT